jgi:hypothetical protein
VTTLYRSLLHTLSSSVTFSTRLLGNGFQRRTFPLLWIPEWSLCLDHSNSTNLLLSTFSFLQVQVQVILLQTVFCRRATVEVLSLPHGKPRCASEPSLRERERERERVIEFRIGGGAVRGTTKIPVSRLAILIKSLQGPHRKHLS